MTRQLEMKPLLGGAFGIMERQEEPVMIHGLAAHSFQIATFTQQEDALLFLSVALPETEQGMSAELLRFCMLEGLQHVDAEELLHLIAEDTPDDHEGVAIQKKQMAWVRDFIARWEAAEQVEGFWNAPVVEKKEA